jgi:hypothetical protein
MGLTLRYPGDWQLKEEDQSAILLYPASADPQEAAEVISFQFRSDIPYQPESSQAGKTDPKPIAVSGLNGVYREDTALAIPTESYSIELPYRSGTMVVGATEGPAVNLVPQLQEILKTVALQP